MATSQAHDLLDELEREMKGLEFGLACGKLRVNSSLAILAAQTLRVYLRGEMDEAAEGFETLADEIRARQRLTASKAPQHD